MLQIFYFLFSLLLGSIAILLCFFFLLCIVFNNFFKLPVEIENLRLKIAFATSTGAPITVVNNAREMLPIVSDY